MTWAMSVAIRVAMSELRHRRWKDVSLDEVNAGADLAPERAIVDYPVWRHSRSDEAILDAMHEVIRNGLTAKQRRHCSQIGGCRRTRSPGTSAATATLSTS